jgi:putative Holliday junction resolvase
VTDTSTGLPRGSRVGVDVGSVRVGLAASDPDGVVATPVETVPRDAAGWTRYLKALAAPAVAGSPATVPAPPTDLARIAAEVEERFAAVVYVGLPRHLSGSEGSASQAARVYAGALASVVAPVPVRLVDERMSTVSAHQALHASGRSGRRHRQVVDQAAAVVILQSALEAERAGRSRAGERVDIDPAPPARGAAGDGETTER